MGGQPKAHGTTTTSMLRNLQQQFPIGVQPIVKIWRLRWLQVLDDTALRASTSAVRQTDRLRGAAHPVVNIRTSAQPCPKPKGAPIQRGAPRSIRSASVGRDRCCNCRKCPRSCYREIPKRHLK